jgi:hypothetical protein
MSAAQTAEAARKVQPTIPDSMVVDSKYLWLDMDNSSA